RVPGEGDGRLVARQAVEVGAVERGERLKLVQRTGGLESLGVQRDAGVRGENAGAAARGFLGAARMRGAVRAEKQPRAAGGDRREQRGAVLLRLQYRPPGGGR